ncbi:MAG: hypothetical protein JSV91_07450 [Phycisphaerales bacterium]|nr:MAG: hypothetical protein JSV91_07450 [Phycisphaerales bacterium]
MARCSDILEFVHRRAILSAFLLLCLMLFGIFVPSARGQETALHFLEPTISRQHYALLCQSLDLASDQRRITDILYDDYASALDRVIARADALAEQAGRQRVEDALTGKAIIPPDELRRLRVAVLRTYSKAWPDCDHLLEQLVTSTESILRDDQLRQFKPALRALRRAILLHPRQAEALYPEYAGDGVDVLLLVDQATAPKGELKSLDPASLDGILQTYELKLDALLRETAPDYRRAKLEARIARMQKDAEAIAARQHESVTLWQRLYQLNVHTVRTIGEVAAETLGENARADWLDRFNRESFAWLFAPKKPDRQYGWISRNNVSAERRAAAEEVYVEYRTKRGELVRQAIEIMLRGRLEFQTMLYSMMDPAGVSDSIRRGLYQDLLKNSGELAGLETAASADLEALLSEDQRQSMRRALRRR